MANKSVAYMLVAVLIGVTLITAVPDQIARYANPGQMLSMESGDGESTVVLKAGEGNIELYLDTTNITEEDSTDDHEIWFDVANSTHGGPWNASVEEEGYEFSIIPDDGVSDLSNDVDNLADQLKDVSGEFAEIESSIADVESVAADAVAAAEAAAEAVNAVAATANAPSGSGVDAADAAEAARSAASGLATMVMFAGYAFSALFAFGVYLMAKKRFG